MDAEKGSVARWGLHCLLRLDRIGSGEVLMKEETKMRTTAQVLVDCLEAEGVDVIFGIPGEETLDLMFAIRDSKIRFIPVRHEQGAAFMADVYGRLTGRAGVWAPVPPTWSRAWQMLIWMVRRWWPSRGRWAPTGCS